MKRWIVSFRGGMGRVHGRNRREARARFRATWPVDEGPVPPFKVEGSRGRRKARGFLRRREAQARAWKRWQIERDAEAALLREMEARPGYAFDWPPGSLPPGDAAGRVLVRHMFAWQAESGRAEIDGRASHWPGWDAWLAAAEPPSDGK